MNFADHMVYLKMKTSVMILGFLMVMGFAHAAVGVEMDSVGIERIDGKTYIIHEVASKETLFAISRRYETPVGDIIKSNSDLKQGLKIGQRILVPYITKTEVPEGAKLHKVNPGETLFAVAKKYNVSVEEVKAWNDLKGNDLSVGQGLIIKGVKPAEPKEIAEKQVKETATEASKKVKEMPEKAKEATEKKIAKAEEKAAERKEAKEEKAKEKIKEEKEEGPTEAPRIENIPEGAEVGWISHTVVKGETLFSIAKQYDAKVEDLINWNALASNNLALGQVLKVGRKGEARSISTSEKEGGEKIEKVAEKKPSYNVNESASNTSTAYKNIKESGQAEVIKGTGNHKKYLVLHRDAPVGTIMRIRNEENDVMIFARVVGKLPDTGDNGKLLIKVSQAAFDQLRAVNTRFRVEVSY
ncbi:LysM peptidoglycan-binding domain-containing protein [Echinicola jeungdonensis]|uniref:LysM peptidoglycan-binding domain-containing protein n=1 Tax=Echinicola jeungdonensis TaxID=709343 RepID=A0ABV5JA97_9BACT|nr:LysM peptidoglycan-binding domain-containing protein [Echinicola jeungdonensis]MDN3669890.1 LysM peptidoglycan-binding domain-containing protein [Echinicola jeungdonensis]